MSLEMGGIMSQRRLVDYLRFVAVATCLQSTAAFADETVSIGGSRVVVIKPAAPHGSVILMPGGDGAIRAGDQGDIHGVLGNQLVRTRHAYAARGLAVMVADVDTDLASAVKYMAAIKRPVTVIATSRGTVRAAEGIARGARPDALVLTSGFLSPESGGGNNVMSILGSPSALPRTLVIHHTQAASSRCLLASIHSSNGRAGVPTHAGSAAERTRAIPARPWRITASMVSTARLSASQVDFTDSLAARWRTG
jgi:hypothetical protein